MRLRPPFRRAVDAAVEQLEGRRLFAFGVTQTTGSAASYVIDNGGDLVFRVLRPGATTSSTIHLGDVTSIRYKNVELLAPYSTTSRYSHYEQGLSSSTTVTTTTGGAPGSRWILVTCDDSAIASGAVIQYYAVRENDNNLYMASLPKDVNNGPGEGRFIAYLNRNVFGAPEAPSDNAPKFAGDTVTAIEGSDVFGHSDGTTTSKFYNMGRRMIENEVHGLVSTSPAFGPIGAYMHMGDRERSAGGPFFKDIDFQASGAVELYNCIFTGHTQTETYRQGLHTYAMQFATGTSIPAAPDYAFLESIRDPSNNLLIQGLIPASARGAVAGTATGNPAGHETVVTLTNAAAQYWDMADANGNYSIANVLPGTYTETIYDNELAVGTRTVTVTAGQTTQANLVNAFYTPPTTIFRIGTWDGTPVGFLNADRIETMHPSDVRMSSWTSLTNFVVGTNTDAQFPMAQFMGVNNSMRLTFSLASNQVQNLTFRVGITLGFEGARPKITVNGGQSYSWTSGNPSASRDLNSRGITRGTWRGDNQLYTFSIPAANLRAGTNTIDMGMISGSYVNGQTWLSPNAVFDALDLVASSTAAPTGVFATVTPANSTVAINGSKAYTGTARGATGAPIVANLDWSATRGKIDPNGNYVAPATAGSDTVTAVATVTRTPGYSIGSGSPTAFGASITGTGTTGVTITDEAPTVATAASASFASGYARTATLSALGADDGGEANLTYTWSGSTGSAGTVSFGATNGTNAGKSTTATFSAPGTYGLLVTIADAAGKSVTSRTSVTIRNPDTWLRADETSGTALADAANNGNAASLTGTTAFVAGVNGNAVRFSNGGYATLPVGINAGLNDFTVATWVNPDAIATWQRVFDFGSGTNAYMFLTTRSSAGGLRFAITTSGTGGEQVVDGPALAVGVWTHLAVTLSGNTATLYVNGAAVASNANVTLRPSSIGSATKNRIGLGQFAGDPALQASLDDFRIAGRALSAAEVASLATPAAPTNLTATAGDASVALAWDAAAGATSYTIRRSTLPGGPYTTVASGLTGTTFADAGLANGTTYYYVVAATNAGAGADSAEASAAPTAPSVAPTLAAFAINEGAAQRSMVRSLTFTFDQPVTLDAAGLTITRRGATAAQPFVLTPTDEGRSVVVTFTGVVGGSLADGVYDLTLAAGAVRNASGQSLSTAYAATFHRLFGDGDGDRDVDNADLFQFRLAQNSTSASPNYRATLDYDRDGDIDNADLFQFRLRQNTSL